MSKQEQEMWLAALVREKESEERGLAQLAEQIERTDMKAERDRLKQEQARHAEILKAVEDELAKASGSARTSKSRAARR